MYSRVVGTSVSLLGFGHGACVLFQYTVPVDPPNRQLPESGSFDFGWKNLQVRGRWIQRPLALTGTTSWSWHDRCVIEISFKCK